MYTYIELIKTCRIKTLPFAATFRSQNIENQTECCQKMLLAALKDFIPRHKRSQSKGGMPVMDLVSSSGRFTSDHVLSNELYWLTCAV